MYTCHLSFTPATIPEERPAKLPLLGETDFVKGKYADGDRRCYTARMLDIFLPVNGPQYVLAYREFRLATMDYMYEHHNEDHANTGATRAACFNAVAKALGYVQE